MIASRENPLVQQLLDTTREIAIEAKIVSQEVVDFYVQSLKEAESYLGVSVKQRTPEKVEELSERISQLSKEDELALSRLMAVETIVINGMNNYFNNKTNEPLADRFENVIEGLLEDSTDPKTTVEELRKTKDDLLVSLVFTMHPVVFHSQEGRKGEQTLSARLEFMDGLIEGAGGKVPNEALKIFKEKLRENMNAIAYGATVTPFDQVTIANETQTEMENIDRIEIQMPRVIVKWNEAIDRIAEKKTEIAEDLQGLKFDEEQAKDLFELRTWGRSADGDGRKFATSIALFDGIAMGVEDGEYKGPKLDLRQNAEIHRDYVSALIQIKFNNDEAFRNFCTDFIRDHNVKSDADGWLSPERSIFQQLPESERSNFLRQVIERGFDLSLEGIDEETIKFNNSYRRKYKAFLKAKELPETTTFQEMPRELQNEFGSILEKDGYKIESDGLSYKTIGNPNTGHDVFFNRRKLEIEYITSPDGTPAIDEETGQQRQKHHLVGIPDVQKTTLLDVPKRLAVINHGIDKYGDAVADRHQIANFEEAADFYAEMLLFSQHGLITIEDGKVTSAKMDIQPLLETVDDMKRGKEIFRELLQDPMVRSYYEERGTAQIMLGFSDGSKSAGNFASQWQIYKTAREIQQVFEEEFGQEIADGKMTVRFLQGRGRGKDRGGTDEMGVAQKLMPPEVNKSGTYDVTTQADQPMNMASSPKAAQDSIGSMLIGAMTSGVEAKAERDPNQDAYEKAIDLIAEVSEKTFVANVKRNPDALDFIDGVPLNDERTSRSKKRASSTKGSWDSRRAIGIEYGFNMGKLPAHEVGLKAGITAFMESGMEIPDGEGNLVSGMDALKVLYEKNTFFKAQIDIRSSAMENQYDPAMARMYGEMSGTKVFVEDVIGELKGLADYLRDIAGKSTHAARARADDKPIKLLDSVSVIAHAIIRNHDGIMPDREQDPNLAKIIKNASFVNAQAFGHPETSPELRKNAEVSFIGK